ncbi:hypothetical protein EDD16DRAFT_1706068 [Pisolithus croceorrhizus]|nr:hypothetical protein EDD16DRAFT_1706068 [Pisolithus croceorrhizus]KAI6122107.1 hypothetical protein EV401DRAFT_1887327 [Pisolithus croceorrhizus]
MPLKVPEDSLRGQLLEVDSIEVVTAESSCSSLVEGQHEASFKNLQGTKIVEKPEEQNKGELLGAKASVKLEATEALGDSPAPQTKYPHSPSSPYTDILPQIPPIEPQDAQDEPRTDE